MSAAAPPHAASTAMSASAASTAAGSAASAAATSSPPVVQSGRFVYPHGAVYEGEFTLVDGKPQRHGRGRFADRDVVYDGTWAHDEMDGAGTYSGASGCTYTGGFSKGQYHGEGEYRWPDGAVYRGHWERSKMHGTGEYVNAERVKWVGKFVNGYFDNGKTLLAVR